MSDDVLMSPASDAQRPAGVDPAEDRDRDVPQTPEVDA